MNKEPEMKESIEPEKQTDEKIKDVMKKFYRPAIRHSLRYFGFSDDTVDVLTDAIVTKVINDQLSASVLIEELAGAVEKQCNHLLDEIIGVKRDKCKECIHKDVCYRWKEIKQFKGLIEEKYPDICFIVKKCDKATKDEIKTRWRRIDIRENI
jgi:hypothetical protein